MSDDEPTDPETRRGIDLFIHQIESALREAHIQVPEYRRPELRAALAKVYRKRK